MFRCSSPAELTGLDEYCLRTGETFCPYLLPALKRRCVLFSLYQLEGEDEEALSETVFYLGIIHTELLRVARREAADPFERELVCENVLVTPPSTLQDSNILSWPHWLLKLLYTRFRIMFGKFRPGVVEAA